MNNTGLKFGGREKGSLNKKTNEIREYYQLLINNNLDTLQRDIESLEPKDRIKVILEISKFILPTLKATEIEDKSGGKQIEPIIIQIVSENETNRD
jgi:hypothetical protein